MSNQNGNWIQTYTGKCFYPLDPRPEDIDIRDIAHSLSMLCRYNGHCRKFYSVAEHCVHVSKLVPPEHALWGLLHDAEEAYTSDIPRPLKAMLKIDDIALKVSQAVVDRFKLKVGPGAILAVYHSDNAIISDERKALMNPCEKEWPPLPPPTGVRIECWCPEQAESRFLDRFFILTKGRSNG